MNTYYIQGPMGRINRKIERETEPLQPFADLTEEQKATVDAGFESEPKQYYFLIEGELVIPEIALGRIPQELTPRQLRLQLIDEGIVSAQIEAILNSIPDATAKEKALVEWEYALVIKRNHPLIVTLGQALGKTDAEIDILFLNASKIN
jgi:hypothetical protein